MKTFIFCLKDGFKKCFDFKGRTRRRNHWLFAVGAYLSIIPISFVIAIIIRFPTVYLSGLIGALLIWVLNLLQLLVILFIIISYLSSAVRRIHDSGKSGWFYLVPFYNFYLLVRKRDNESNKWGVPNS